MNTALNNEIEKVYSVTQVAKMLDLNIVTIRRYIKSKQLPAVKIGRVWRIPHSDLAKFMSTNQ